MYMSRLARALSELTTRRIVLLVLVCVIITPFLDPYAGAYARQNEDARISALTSLHRSVAPHSLPDVPAVNAVLTGVGRYSQDKNVSVPVFEFTVNEFATSLPDRVKLVYLDVCGPSSMCSRCACLVVWFCLSGWLAGWLVVWLSGCPTGSSPYPLPVPYHSIWTPSQLKAMIDPDATSHWRAKGLSGLSKDYRTSEVDIITARGCYSSSGTLFLNATCVSTAVFSVLPQMQSAALFSIFTTIFIFFVIVISTFLFTHDSDVLV